MELQDKLRVVVGGLNVATTGMLEIVKTCDEMRDNLKKCRSDIRAAVQEFSACNWALYVSNQANEKLERENAVLQEHISMLEARLSEKED